MVTFLTLLLGLVVGERQIELAVDDRVRSVELWLDTTLVGVVRGPPWSLACDFGEALAPHLLQAVARDGQGQELDRAVQGVNLPREPAEVSLALHGGELGYRAVEVAWYAPGAGEPEEIHVHFDGERLELSGRLAALPPHDRLGMHIVTAELVFPGELRATGELAFGGEFGEEVTSELTAVPLEPGKGGSRRRLPSAVEVESWLRAGNAVPNVVAVERGPFELMVVRDEASLDPLRRMQVRARSGKRIESEDVLRVVSTRPLLIETGDERWSALYSVSQNLNGAGAGIGWAMTRRFFSAQQEGTSERLSGAVAVAGLRAAGSNRPRGVLLVRGSRMVEPEEHGLGPRAIREYLAALRVPFLYWRLDEGGDATPDGWGEPTVIRDHNDLQRAASDVVSALRPQFVVWLEGRHKPDDVIAIAGPSPPLRLAGAVVR